MVVKIKMIVEKVVELILVKMMVLMTMYGFDEVK